MKISMKKILLLTILSIVFFLFENPRQLRADTEIQTTDVIHCIDKIIDNEFVYRPFGKLRFTEKNLTDSIFKELGIYREKCESGFPDYMVISYSFSKESNKYNFLKSYQKDEYFWNYVEIINNFIPLYIKKEEREIRIGYSKEKVAEILGIKNSTICDILHITDEDWNSDITLYFEANSLKKIVLQSYL